MDLQTKLEQLFQQNNEVIKDHLVGRIKSDSRPVVGEKAPSPVFCAA
ncbi:hypothetical protein AAULR_13789 [Lacticaseibacillus rhamnosus MTCC 5462]|nr:hypothetical protein AAULR_13789 [Lacticaseibacillus rhamnosus MTCC 5462]